MASLETEVMKFLENIQKLLHCLKSSTKQLNIQRHKLN
jgi:hypothetical protein